MPWEIPEIRDRLVKQIVSPLAEVKDKIEDQHPQNIKLTLVYQRAQELHHQKLLSDREEDEDEWILIISGLSQINQ